MLRGCGNPLKNKPWSGFGREKERKSDENMEQDSFG
jgi:hypothetical protein